MSKMPSILHGEICAYVTTAQELIYTLRTDFPDLTTDVVTQLKVISE